MTTSVLQKRRLGRTNISVTEFALGGYMFTGEFGVSRSEALAIMDCALNAGVNYVDTAQMYGFGEGEELVGRALASHQDQPIHVSTKVGWLDRTVIRNLGDAAYQDENALRRTIDHSFWLLRRDYIDIMMVHEPDWELWGIDMATGDAAIVHVLEEYKRNGAIGAIGLGSWDCSVTTALINTGRFDVALVAGGYTLIQQQVKTDVISAAKKYDVGLIMGGTFLQGLLAVQQRERMKAIQSSGAYKGVLSEENIRRILAIYDLSDETGISLTEMCIRYILADPDISTVIPGAQCLSHLEENLMAATRGALPADLVARIDQISQS